MLCRMHIKAIVEHYSDSRKVSDMSSSYITGSGSSGYTGLGGLFRVRLQQSDNPKLQALAQQLGQQDKRAKILQDVISPKGFVGVDGKMKYIPGISFSNDSALFDALKAGSEISEERLKQQIDAFAKKRQEAEFNRKLESSRQSTQEKIFEKQREQRSKRQKAQLAANNAYLEKVFGINKTKTEFSAYSNSNKPLDSQIFGAYSGSGATDFINNYSENGDLTSHFAQTISYDSNSNDTKKSSVRIADYQYSSPTQTPDSYVVRLTGDAKHDPDKDPGSKLAAPEGYLTYKDAANTVQTINGSEVKQLTQAEFDTLEYVSDFTGRDDSDEEGKRLQRQDFLSVMAVANVGGVDQRGYVSKISLTRGDFSATPSQSGNQVYHAKMTIPKEQFFNAVTLHAEGTYPTDGSSSINATDGSLLDMINEDRVTIFAREIGYDTRLFIDTAKSSNDTIVFTKDSTKLVGDGVELFITVKEADRANISFSALNIGTGKA